jgi:hypothetical protein
MSKPLHTGGPRRDRPDAGPATKRLESQTDLIDDEKVVCRIRQQARN